MLIRHEQPADYRAVEILTREAFWNVYRPGCTEHYVLHRYRNRPDFIPELDFVLEEEGRIIGHVMYSKAEIALDAGGVLPICTFGPISIHPSYKRRGYGLALLRHSLAEARRMGLGAVCMEGNIDFYGHAGFTTAHTLGIHYHAEPREAEVPYFLALELSTAYLWGHEGTYRPPRGYFVAEAEPEAFARYEASLPPVQADGGRKCFREGQLPQFCRDCGRPLTAVEDCGSLSDGTCDFTRCRQCAPVR